MPDNKYDAWRERLTHGAPLAVLLATGLYLAYQLLFILELIAIAMLIALLLRSVVDWLKGYGVRPWMSSLLMVGVFVSFGIFIWFVLLPNVLEEIQKIFSTTSGILNQAATQSREEQGIFALLPDLTAITNQIQGYLAGLENRLPQLTNEIFQVTLNVIAALFLAMYLAINPGAPVEGILRLAPRHRRDEIRTFFGELAHRLRGWMVGAGIAMLFVGTTATVGLWLIGIPLFLAFGIIAGILNIIPFLGSILGALLPALVALTISPVKALLVLVLFLVINQIEGNVIQPLVMGREADLHPVLVILSFLLLGALLGPAGLLLAVPAVILLMTILNHTVLDKPSQGVNEVDEEILADSSDVEVPRQ